MRILATALIAALSFVTPAAAQDDARPRTPVISVSGTGEAELKPDFARLLVTVSTQADTVAPAVDANRTATERVLGRIQALGIKREDIRTQNFQVFQTPPRVGHRAPVEEKGREILECFLATASGRRTKSEELGFGGAEFVPWAMGAVM